MSEPKKPGFIAETPRQEGAQGRVGRGPDDTVSNGAVGVSDTNNPPTSRALNTWPQALHRTSLASPREAFFTGGASLLLVFGAKSFRSFDISRQPGRARPVPPRPCVPDASNQAIGGIIGSASVHLGRKRMAKTGEIIELLFLDASRALTCSGCGQIGPMPSASDDAATARRRSAGFYLFADTNGGTRVACCRCQQIQAGGAVALPGDTNLAWGAATIG